MQKKLFKYLVIFFFIIGQKFCLAQGLSMHIQDGDIRLVLSSLARTANINLILDGSIQGRISLNVDNVEAEQLFAMIANTHGLLFENRDGVFLMTKPQKDEFLLLRPYSFYIKYADLETVRQAVILSLIRKEDSSDEDKNKEVKKINDVNPDNNREGRRVVIDSATSRLILFGTYEEKISTENIIQALDVPIEQIAIEAQVLSIDDNAAKNLGVNWSWSQIPQYPDYEIEYERRRVIVQDDDGTNRSVLEDVPRVKVNRTFPNGVSGGILNFGRSPEGHPFEFYYAAEINALIQKGKAKVLARPNIMTLQGREAVINIGGEVPVPEVTNTNTGTTTNIKYREAGIILRCTPRVNPDGEITTTIHTEVSSPSYVPELKAYEFRKRSADTTVRLQNGETIIIGGLIGSEESRVLAKIPFLGDLPILGAFFKSVKRTNQKNEVMIFLTAHIVSPEKLKEKSAEKETEFKNFDVFADEKKNKKTS